ncbi:MAG: type II toxin-antitoxin system HicA family toxin [Candidatus Aenigmarchaeota archaeon]|nr:type II toxin-antitoxin system HicA family toxin [Candidatus Aenigmarchaeota archaeon]
MRLPIIAGRELVKILIKAGFEVDHITGSHIILRQAVYPYLRVTVPNHPELKKGTLLSILKRAGLTRELLFKLLNRR